jgi:GxxExxY protein
MAPTVRFTTSTRGVMKMLFPDESYRIMAACFEVHNRMGCGFTEAVYQECLEIELEFQGIPFLAQHELQLAYREKTLKQTFKPDFICYDKIVVEIKAAEQLIGKHEAQVINYLNATGYELGILVNFGTHPKLEYKRLALSKRS